ncbi:toll/interleukin-1 receptor domain-containing protein [Trichocoleus sp. FACHB-262]|uniref:toll/interleukin-1 receptor domain-containing protein n=1 Tax=Trichocoleus sp. FACHB-262 TaxID=2692869 RepID=UPI001686AE7B|nr:toll/interleukin-1 receptor domain-containing protein [Trichocoleus sp. FACHB-262]MBD2124750.1 toll/interleukin-1 receptor domain-containing protein [Trichocoleus sp. FACHB-262]
MAEGAIRVFISYSRDSEEHQKKVLGLAQALRDDGIDCMIDEFVLSPDNWDRWMLNQIDESDFVLIICSERYYRRYRGQEEASKGLGVTWESTLIMGRIYDAQGKNGKFHPVFFGSPDKAIIPDGIRTSFYNLSQYDLPNLETNPDRLKNDGGYKELYRLLTDQPFVVPKKVGSLKKLEPLHGQSELLTVSPSQDADSLANLVLEMDSGTLQQNLVNLQKQGTAEECRKAITQTSQWLLQHPNESYVRNQLLKLVQSKAKVDQQYQVIDQTTLWLSENLEASNSYTLTEYLKLVTSQGTPEQGQNAVSLISKWLEQVQPNDPYVRRNCLILAKQKATLEVAQEFLTQTYSWLSKNLKDCDSYIMTEYLRLAIESGTTEQKQKAKEKAASWLESSDNSYVRTQYLKLLKIVR